MELYLDPGYEQTTVADIAARAGLTSRTFFRYFADKREVLFAGSQELEAAMVEALETADPGASPMEAVGAALQAGARMLGGNQDFSRQRQEVIVANAELLEREVMKLASLAAALGAGLRRRGTSEPEASLAAQTGIGVFRVAFERWTSGPPDRSLLRVMRDSLKRLKALTAT